MAKLLALVEHAQPDQKSNLCVHFQALADVEGGGANQDCDVLRCLPRQPLDSLAVDV
eukprot:CAMPEP_0175764466 /NCGR_PEP_ID=MMETSP0097-20121207/68292_1 /TAXON_ID=311494 /ORGANISM="Alexandrium monilatum, Strain CCMP3105" /LENGTH=56 /DNA_ID=CAMNT_0017074277 /DNA_START=39 /DNA_END=206 /DNA_ORIENTATION=+